MSLKLHRFDLLPHGIVLATRSRGKELGRLALDSLGNSRALLLNFTGVEVASPSFLDELLLTVRSLTAGGDSGNFLAILGLNPDVNESLVMVLERRKLVIAAIEEHRLGLLGAPEQLTATLNEASALGATFTAPELADRLAIKLPALHQRLKALTDAGVLARTADPSSSRGLRHTYSQLDMKVVDDAEQPAQPA